jgi:hypothetical protein
MNEENAALQRKQRFRLKLGPLDWTRGPIPESERNFLRRSWTVSRIILKSESSKLFWRKDSVSASQETITASDPLCNDSQPVMQTNITNDPTGPLASLAALCNEVRASYCTRSDPLTATATLVHTSPAQTLTLTATVSTNSNSQLLPHQEEVAVELEEEEEEEEEGEEPPLHTKWPHVNQQEEDEDPYRWWQDGMKTNNCEHLVCCYYHCAHINTHSNQC